MFSYTLSLFFHETQVLNIRKKIQYKFQNNRRELLNSRIKLPNKKR